MSHIEYIRWDIEEKIKYLDWIPEDVKTILDVGVGRGEFLSLISSRYDAYGCDNDPFCVRLSSKFGNVKLADAVI